MLERWEYIQGSKRDTEVENRLWDSVGEGEGGMIWENKISFLKYCLFKLTGDSVKVWPLWRSLSYPEHNITRNSVGVVSISDSLPTTEFHL